MIIWGSRGRTVDVGKGEFNCPNCGIKRQYIQKKAGRWFTLYFIPIFKMQDLGEFVECQTCKRTYQADVLSYRPPSANQRALMTVRNDLIAGMPLHMVKTRLINAGVDPEAAEMAVKVEAGSEVKTCPKCEFQYHPKVTVCSNCGTALP
jgi:hypothetical protein